MSLDDPADPAVTPEYMAAEGARGGGARPSGAPAGGRGQRVSSGTAPTCRSRPRSSELTQAAATLPPASR